jgi:hypothetical protein
MKCSMTLGDMNVSDHEVGKWPENPTQTIAAYLKASYPEDRVWIVQDEPGQGFAKKVWYKADKKGKLVGDACASLTISED